MDSGLAHLSTSAQEPAPRNDNLQIVSDADGFVFLSAYERDHAGSIKSHGSVKPINWRVPNPVGQIAPLSRVSGVA